MAILLSCQKLAKSFGARPLFEGLSFGLSDGECTGLIGPNGAGKSTLLKILAASEKPDSGAVMPRRGLRLGYLAQQDVRSDASGQPAEIIKRWEIWDWKSMKRTAAAGLARALGPRAAGGALSGGCANAWQYWQFVPPDLLLLDEPITTWT